MISGFGKVINDKFKLVRNHGISIDSKLRMRKHFHIVLRIKSLEWVNDIDAEENLAISPQWSSDTKLDAIVEEVQNRLILIEMRSLLAMRGKTINIIQIRSSIKRESKIKKINLRTLGWFGHVRRMDRERNVRRV